MKSKSTAAWTARAKGSTGVGQEAHGGYSYHVDGEKLSVTVKQWAKYGQTLRVKGW